MPMPNRNIEGDYRYDYQGQEKDSETGMEAFELRLWDARIGRWSTTDPASQFYSTYLGMGNNPINGVDPDGGKFILTGLTTAQRAKWNTYIESIRGTKLGRYIYDKIENDENWLVDVIFRENSPAGNFEYDPTSKKLYFGDHLSDAGLRSLAQEKGNWNHPTWVITGHEIWHAWQHYKLQDELIRKLAIKYKDGKVVSYNKEYRFNYLEPEAVKFQNYLYTGGNLLATEENTKGLRTHYGQRKSFDTFGSFLIDYHNIFSKLNTLQFKSNLDNFPSRFWKFYTPKSKSDCGC